MSIYDPVHWRLYTPREMLAYLDEMHDTRGKEADNNGSRKKPAALILQSLVSPLDLYAYLKARFGEPNGIQTKLVRQDSDNIFHWDYFLESGDGRVVFTGATQEVHVWMPREMTDTKWLRFITNLKNDFGRVGQEKGEMVKTFEKWHVFPNRYLSIANRCAELHHTLSTALPRITRELSKPRLRSSDGDFLTKAKIRSNLITKVTEACIELPILTPVMFETFIGLIVAFMTKPEIRDNSRLFESFQRSPLDVKLYDLANRCLGFERPITPGNPVRTRYWAIVNRRNDIMHGNVDPVRDATEIIYFDGKRPLYTAGADRIVYLWESLLRQYNPDQVLSDYLTAHEFMGEIIDHMTPNYRDTMRMVMQESQPGWDDKRKKLGILFPDRVHMTNYEGLRHDSDLQR